MKYFKYYIDGYDSKENEFYRVYPNDKWEYWNHYNGFWQPHIEKWTDYYGRYSESLKQISKTELFIEIL